MSMVSRNVVLLGTATGLAALVCQANAQDSATPPVKQQETIVVEGQVTVPASSADRVLLKHTRSATKTDSSVAETPQSITTITRKQLDDQNPQTVSEALRYTAGVLSDRDTNTRYDSIFLRGFGAFGTATSYANYLDGLKLPRGQAFAQTSIDPYLLDRIDVLKGPSALLYGQISPGGMVNQISRLPSDQPFNEVRVEAGTDGRVQGGLSSQGKLSDDGSLQYGVSASSRRAGTRYDNVDEKRVGIAPSLTWRPSAATTLTLSGYYQKDPEGGYFNSLYPRFLAPPTYRQSLGRKLDIGDPNFDAFERKQSGLGYHLEHRINSGLTLRSTLRRSRVDTDFQSLQMAGPLGAAGLIPRQALRSIEDVNGLSMDNQAEFGFNTGAVQHTLLTGIDYQHSKSNWQYRYGGAPALNVLNPRYGQAIGPLSTIIDSGQTLQQTGVYLQDQASVGNWRAVLGLRHDRTEQDTANRLAQNTTDQSSSATSYRAGLLYLFDNGIAPYASYSTSFEPTVGVDAGGAPFVPSKARQHEVGVKYQPPGSDALFTVSAFDIRQKDALVPDIIGFNVQEGEIRSRGVEVEARGRVTRNVELIAALTLLDTKVTETSVAANVGKRPQAVPTHFGSLWANYTIHTGALEGLMIGGGVRVVGASYADNINQVQADSYTLVDAALRYDFGATNSGLKGLEGTLNVTNLLDKTYYSSCSSGFYCQYGNGRTVLAGLRYRW